MTNRIAPNRNQLSSTRRIAPAIPEWPLVCLLLALSGPCAGQISKPTGCGFSGNWNAEFVVRADPGRQAARIDLTTAPLTVTAEGSRIELKSAARQIRFASGAIDRDRCLFNATGAGDVGGKNGVAFRIIRGRVEGGFLCFELEIGIKGTLPAGSTSYFETAGRQ